MCIQPSPLPVAINLPSGLNVRAYNGRLWSRKTCKHSPVTESHSRAVPSNDDLDITTDIIICSQNKPKSKAVTSYVASSSFVPIG